MKMTTLKVLVLAAAIFGVVAGLAGPLHASTEKAATPVAQNQADNSPDAIQQEIEAQLAGDASFIESNLATRVTDQAVILMGSVRDLPAHEKALKIAHAYAGDRTVVDQLRIQRLYPSTN